MAGAVISSHLRHDPGSYPEGRVTGLFVHREVFRNFPHGRLVSSTNTAAMNVPPEHRQRRRLSPQSALTDQSGERLAAASDKAMRPDRRLGYKWTQSAFQPLIKLSVYALARLEKSLPKAPVNGNTLNRAPTPPSR